MNENTSQPPPINSHESGSVPPCPFQSLHAAWQRGQKDARDAAHEAIPRIKSAAAEAAYWLTYGISFAGSFQLALAKKLTPDAVKKGFHQGVQEGQAAADQFASRCRQAGKGSTPSTDASQAAPA